LTTGPLAFPTRPKDEVVFHRLIGLSSSHLHNLWSSWAQLTNACRALGEQFKFADISPDFMSHFSNLTRAFTQFNKFAIVIFNSAHPEDDLHTQLSRSAVWQWGELVIQDWNVFIVQLNEIIHDGIPRFLPILVTAVDHTMQAVLALADLYFVGCITSNVTPGSFAEIRTELGELRLMLTSRTELDLNKFLELVQQIILHVNNTFLIVSPRFTYSSGELIQDKLQVKIALKELTELTSGLVRFDEGIRAVKQLAFLFNSHLMDAMGVLRLPWQITLTSPNEKAIRIDRFDTADTPPPPPPLKRTPRRRR
jgi:hypothetical protein